MKVGWWFSVIFALIERGELGGSAYVTHVLLSMETSDGWRVEDNRFDDRSDTSDSESS
jgi:hypothetical protein